MSTPETPPPGGDRDSALSGVQRAGIVLGAIAVLLIALVVIRSGGDSGSGSSATTTTTQTATTSGGASSTATTGGSSSGTTDGSSGATTTGDSATTTSGSDDSATTTDDSGGAATTGSSTSGTASTPATAPASVPTIRVAGGQPQGGVKTLSFKKGDRIRFKVVSDVADEIHVHGYDVKKNVTAGGTVQFTFPATIEGRFEVELEQAHTQIAQLEVAPS
ncbi:MAG: hypothetical protein QOJ21_2206 [Solirubrobacteraceae bacterium]|jgi:hypothetical protein|nr:hypothetical protein [Solirubrobacteraceae bacterium]